MKYAISFGALIGALVIMGAFMVLGAWLFSPGSASEAVRGVASLTQEVAEGRTREVDLRQQLDEMEYTILEARKTEARLRGQLKELRAEGCLFAILVPDVGIVVPHGELATAPVPPGFQSIYVCGRGLQNIWPAPEGVPILNVPSAKGVN